MAVQQRGTRSWQVRVEPFRAVTLPTREAAETVELELKLRKKLGHLYQEKPLTLGEELDGFLDRTATPNRYRPKSEEWLVRSLRPWGPLRDVALPALRRALVEDHITRRARKAPVAAGNELQVLKRALRQAASRGQNVDPGIFEIPAPRARVREGVALTLDQLDELQSWMPEHIKRIVPLTGTVGWRFNEALSLEDKHLDLDQATCLIPTRLNKAGRPKTIHLAAVEVQLLREQLLARAAGTSFVFATRRGRRYGPSSFRDHVWWPALEQMGLKGEFTFHMLRHTAISLSALAGIPPEVIAERVGHNDGGALIRRRYRHLYKGEAASHVAKLDALVGASTSSLVARFPHTATGGAHE